MSAAAEKPNVIILHGDDQLSIRRHLDALLAEMGDPGMADLNTTRLDGRQAGEDEISLAANAMPFLVDRRLVIVTNPFSRAGTDAGRKRFLAVLDGLPPSTTLVLVVEDEFERKGGEWDWHSFSNKKTNWMRKWLAAAGPRASYEICQLPSIKDMPAWVRKEADRKGGKFTGEAASALVSHVGANTQLASQEIDKLLLYVDYKRVVEAEDVEEMTAQTGEADVFAMVDALSAGNARQALALLHRLLEQQEPLSLFGMVVRQFRLLVQARELLDEGRGASVASEMRVHPFVAEKMVSQARRFTMPQLERIYHRLLALDEVMKTSQMPSDLALDTFIVELAR